MTEKLTPQQEALFLNYLEKWRKVALSTERINQKKAKEAIKKAYILIKESEPEVLFCDSPDTAVAILNNLEYVIGYSEPNKCHMFNRLLYKLENYLTYPQNDKCDCKISMQSDDLHDAIVGDLTERALTGSDLDFSWIPDEFEAGNIQPDTICKFMPWYDFCISELKCNHNSEIWQNVQAIVNNCGWIASYQELCVVCDRPCLLTFDEQHKLHGEDKPAIKFTDGYSVYVSHGERLSQF